VRPEIVEEVGERYAIVTFHRHFHHVIHAVLRIPDPGSCFLSIPDPKTATKERGEKKLAVLPFICSRNYLIFELMRKENWANLQRIIELSTPKFVTKPSKI
jgi:hypothetical protein